MYLKSPLFIKHKTNAQKTKISEFIKNICKQSFIKFSYQHNKKDVMDPEKY